MPKKTIEVVPLLVAMAALASLLLDRLLSRGPSERNSMFDAPVFPARQITGGNGPVGEEETLRERYVFYSTHGLIWRCPSDRYAKALGEIALRQLQGRYSLAANRHLYLRAANSEHRALFVRFFPGAGGFSESWSWLAEIADFHGPEVWSCSRDISPEERRAGVKWRGGFLLARRVLDPITFEPKTVFRLFSDQNHTWDPWRRGVVVVGADASLKNGQWTLQWRLEADRGRYVLSNDAPVNPEYAGLFGKPFFLLPVGTDNIP